MELLIAIGVLYAMFVGVPDLLEWLKTREGGGFKARRQLRKAEKRLRAYEEWMDETYGLAIEAQDIDKFAHLVATRVRTFRKDQRAINK